MKPALLLIDIQHDFLQREGLVPPSAELVDNTYNLLSSMRTAHVPIVHVHTIVRTDGSDRMPHWKHNNYWACVEGSAGSQPPHELLPWEDEYVLTKQFYSAFDAPELNELLIDKGVDTVILTGLYAHGCVRATILDAYARGYKVLVASDAVASTEAEHSAFSQAWLEARAANFVSIDGILEKLGPAAKSDQLQNVTLAPMAIIDGSPRASSHSSTWMHRNPSNHEEILIQVPNADAATVKQAIQHVSQTQIKWAPSLEDRQALLLTWAAEIEKSQGELSSLMVLETGKPLIDAIEELDRAVSHIKSTAGNLHEWFSWQNNDFSHRVRYCSVGTIALITPWNNPVAIPVGKIAPALAFGNGVIWKPALPTSRTTMAVLRCLLDAGLPDSLIAVLFGDAQVARNIIKHPDIKAVSLTGSSQTGARVARLCAQHNKALQAELGGNNAAIVMSDADIDTAALALSKSAFSFAGQRCTATRRIIVESNIRDKFVDRLLDAVKALTVGYADDLSTKVGPLISAEQLDKVVCVVEQVLASPHCQLLCGGTVPESFKHGYWFLPTVIETTDSKSSIVQDETFGPVLVVQVATDFDEALELCNKVEQGLAASLYTIDDELQQRFITSAQAGILRINPVEFTIHPDAPFLGWKESGIGPPEHGLWDREFFSQAQVVYK